MKSAPLPILIAAVCLGSAGAGVTTYLVLDSAAADSSEAATPSLESRSSDPELLERIETLAEENRELRLRIEALELRPTIASREPAQGFASEDELEALREELRDSLASRDAPSSEPEEIEEQVAGALSKLRREEQISSVRRYQEKRSARLEQDLGRLSEWLVLEPFQVDEMRVALLAQYEREEEQMRLWEGGADDELLAETKGSDGQRFRADLERFLSPEQLDTFWTKIAGGGAD